MGLGKLVIVSGPSGCGKGTVISELLKRHSDLKLSVSMTTRKPRKGETDGVHYHFTDVRTFEKLIENGGLLEYVKYTENYYGTPKQPIDDAVKNGITVILDIEVEGAENVRKRFDNNLITIFMLPPNDEVLESRLRGRATESENEIELRLKRAQEEIKFKDKYDYIVINDEIDKTVSEIEQIIYNK